MRRDVGLYSCAGHPVSWHPVPSAQDGTGHDSMTLPRTADSELQCVLLSLVSQPMQATLSSYRPKQQKTLSTGVLT